MTRFGTPERIAESCVAEMEPEELLDRMRIASRVLLIIAVVATLIPIMRFAVVALGFYDYLKVQNGYATVEIIVIDETVCEQDNR